MPYIVVHMIKRNVKAKRAVAKAVTDAVVDALKIPSTKVHVIINEMAKDQNATAGVLYCDNEKSAKKPKKTETTRKRKKA